ncbi:MAG: hypothetical protein ABIJ08_05940, partial [Nanoarchaeota archaeon]
MRIPMDIITEIHKRWELGGKPDNFTVDINNRITDSEKSWSFSFVCEFVDEKGYSGKQHGVLSDKCDCSHCTDFEKISSLTDKQLKEYLSTIEKLINKPESKTQTKIDTQYKKAILGEIKKRKNATKN